MLYEKVITGTVNVPNPVHFCADKKRHLMAELQNKYVGRCFMGAYILGIKDILDSGACHIVSTNGSGEGYIDVRFLADVAVFGRWDILVGVEIVSRQQIIVGVYGGDVSSTGKPRAVVSILASKAVEALATGQKIPIRVVRAQHAPMQSQASIVGALLVCDQMAPAYRLRGTLDRSARAELAPMLAAVELELESRAALVKTHRSNLWFFEALLYAYRGAEEGAEGIAEAAAWEGGPVWEGPRHLLAVEEDAEAVSALDIVRRAVAGENVPVAGVWSRSLALYRSSPLVAVARAAPPAAWAVVDGTPRAAFAEFLKNILDFLVATRELVEVYCASTPLDRRLVLWGVMRAAQRPVA
jgi:hypothetical protein